MKLLQARLILLFLILIKIRIKNNMQKWSDRWIAELLHAHEKLFLKFKISKFHNISTSQYLQEVEKLLKLNYFFKKGPTLKNTALCHFPHCYQKLRSFWVRTEFSRGFNRVYKKTTLQRLLWDTSLTKLLPYSKKELFTGVILFDLQ